MRWTSSPGALSPARDGSTPNLVCLLCVNDSLVPTAQLVPLLSCSSPAASSLPLSPSCCFCGFARFSSFAVPTLQQLSCTPCQRHAMQQQTGSYQPSRAASLPSARQRGRARLAGILQLLLADRITIRAWQVKQPAGAPVGVAAQSRDGLVVLHADHQLAGGRPACSGEAGGRLGSRASTLQHCSGGSQPQQSVAHVQTPDIAGRPSGRPPSPPLSHPLLPHAPATPSCTCIMTTSPMTMVPVTAPLPSLTS